MLRKGERILKAKLRGRIERKSLKIPSGAIFSALFIDVVSKYWAENSLAGGRTISGLGGSVKLHLLYNQGATMGFGSSMPIAVSILVIVGTTALLSWALLSKFVPIQIFAGLAAGGSIGNFADRLLRAPGPLRGSVIDWISFFGQNGVFNLADVFIRLGLLVVVIYLIFHDHHRSTIIDKPTQALNR
ncbi:MAG: hypothetical protein EPN30_03015 [Actinomycetota bacterium]|nr:MAG: hypothetical protein EPN30_03015 [Actinomycetota bacterium]